MVLKRASMVWILVASAAAAVLIIGTTMFFAPGEDGEAGLQDTGMVWGLITLLVFFAVFVLLVFKMIPQGHENETQRLKGRSSEEENGGDKRRSRSASREAEAERERRSQGESSHRGR